MCLCDLSAPQQQQRHTSREEGDRALDRDIRARGSRGGTYLTDQDVVGLVGRIRDPANPVDERTLSAVQHVRACQESADAYDWTEYMEQMPKIMELLHAVTQEISSRRRAARDPLGTV